MSQPRSASRRKRSIARWRPSKRKARWYGRRPASRSSGAARHDSDHMLPAAVTLSSPIFNFRTRHVMSSIGTKTLYVASAVAVAWTSALASPLAAAPATEETGGAMSGMQRGGETGMMQHGGGLGMMQHGGGMDMMQHHQAMMAKMHSPHGGMPTRAGQDAFGTIGEIVALLETDPKTDWSKVDLEALRQHLIDMNEVTLHAEAASKQIDGGLEMTITGNGRTLVAIQRMIPAYAQMANGHDGWRAKVSELPNSELLTVTATDPKEVEHIRGLGFIGLLASGSWHQPHHLAMARGEFDHEHLAHQH